jgi:AcrR family transcriptional regulator
MTMDAVAERAGVSKATIYRRWPSKNELAVDAVARLPPSEPLADHGSLAADLTALGTTQAARLERTNIPGIVPRVLAESMGDPELHALLMERGVQPIRALLASLVERAIERGELAADTDVELVVDIIHGTGVYRMLINRGDPTAIVSHVPRLMKLLTG